MIKNKNISIYILSLLSAFLLVFATSCSKDEDNQIDPPELSEGVSYEVLKEYSFDDLKKIENGLENEYLGTALGGLLNIVGSEAKYDGDVQIRIYKVMLKSDNTDGSATKINLSGVLIVPPFVTDTKYRQVVAPPYTYVLNAEAPTNRVTNNNLEPNMIFWIMEAYNHGFAVMMPDYPGFGDSFGQCYIPYTDKSQMVRTTVEYVDAAREVLAKEKYEQNGGFIISGYSLGAYVSLQLAREYETNSVYSDMTVDFLITGGSPCNLLQEANLIRISTEMPQPYLFPLALLGYKNNSYQQLVMGDYLKEPYASESATYLDGTHTNFSDYFPKKTSELFTDAFIKDEGMEDVDKILEDNSVTPWKNSCKMEMTHGSSDETVYYQQAKDFASSQEAAGGSVSFVTTSGTHTSAGIWFYLDLYTKLKDY